MDRKYAFLAAALLALVVAGLCGTSRVNAGETVPGLATPGKLVVGLDDTFAPMGFRDKSRNLIGFDIDLARAVGEELGVEIVFQPVDWGSKEMELATKNVDCLWNGMSRTAEREASMTLSRNYLNNRLVVMTGPDVAIETMDDLAKYDLGTQAASSSLEAIKNNPIYPKIKDKLHEYGSYDECILDMQAGRIQAMVVDEVLGQYKNNNLKAPFGFAPVDFGDDFFVIGFRRDKTDNSENEQLCAAVEKAMQAVIDGGKGEEISKKWFGDNLLLEMK